MGCILFQLPTRGLSVYTFQVPRQWQIVLKSRQLLDILQRAVHFNHRHYPTSCSLMLVAL